MSQKEIIDWLLIGDVSIQYQVHRDLLEIDRPDLQERIAREGWGANFLSKRNPKGHWGKAFYSPKWTSSHYTLLTLRNLSISPNHSLIQESVRQIAMNEKIKDGGVDPSKTIKKSDVCLNGMFLNYASYFKLEEGLLHSIVDFILSQRMADGGFNCRLNRSGARHSSLHSTLSILEGFTEYQNGGYTYRFAEVEEAKQSAQEFILQHRLFLSDRTGEIIHKDFLRLAFPRRWRYDILSALDYFQYDKAVWDDRMQEAIDVILKKKNKLNTWNVQAKHPGEIYFEMEKAGKASRWNTLRVLRVFKHFGI